MSKRWIQGLVAFQLIMGSAVASAEVIAVVGDKQITVKEFNSKYDEVRRSTINPPNKREFLEDLIRYEMGVQEATRRKIQSDPIVQERIRQEVYKGLMEKELGNQVEKIKVSEAEMRAYYKSNPEIRTSHILIQFRPNATPEQKAAAKKRAQEIYKEVLASKRKFEDLVKLYSDDSISKQAGGDVGWQSRVTLLPSYYDAIKDLGVGKITGVVETTYGFHIVKVTGRNSYDNANKQQIRAAVFDLKRKAIFDRYFANLKKKYKISVNSKAIN